MKSLFGVLLAPFRAWGKAQDKTMSEIMEMEEPNRFRCPSYQDFIGGEKWI